MLPQMKHMATKSFRNGMSTPFHSIQFFPLIGRALSGMRTLSALKMSEATDLTPSKPFVCTTPLYYANGPPHMGSAYPTIAADVLSQYYRLNGRDTVFVTGSDEHGEKIATTALANNKEPQVGFIFI